MNRLTNVLVVTLMGLALPAFGQELSTLTPRELQDRAVTAVDGDDAQELLVIMKEMQSRNLLFFTDETRAGCGREPDRVGILQTKPFAWGTARQAYFTFLRQRQIEQGVCGCLTSEMSFDAFATDFVGAPAATMTEAQFDTLLQFKLEHQYEVADQHRAHLVANCRGE